MKKITETEPSLFLEPLQLLWAQNSERTKSDRVCIFPDRTIQNGVGAGRGGGKGGNGPRKDRNAVFSLQED